MLLAYKFLTHKISTNVQTQVQSPVQDYHHKFNKLLLTLSLLRVINVKFPLQLHQKYYIAQYEELGFS